MSDSIELDRHKLLELKDYGLGGRAYLLLRRNNFNQVEDLLGVELETLLYISGFGADSLVELRKALAAWKKDH